MKKHKINHQIKSKQVRLITDVSTVVCSTYEAIRRAKEDNLDLVEMNRENDVSICKIMDYNKFIFNKKKNIKQTKGPTIKEIKLSPNINQHDIDFKLKHAEKFLTKKNKVKLSLKYKGRAITHKEIGELTMYQFIEKLLYICKVEQKPQMKNRELTCMLAPK